MGWTKDEKGFFLITNERDASAFDIYEMSLDGYERKLLYKNEKGHLPGAVSPDRRYVALAKAVTNAASDIDLYDRTTGKLTTIASHEANGEEVANSAEDFSPDGKSLYYTTDQGSQFAYLVRYDLETGQADRGAAPAVGRAAEPASPATGQWFTVFINNDATTELRVFQAAGMKPVKLPAIQADVTGVNFSPNGSHDGLLRRVGRAPRSLRQRPQDRQDPPAHPRAQPGDRSRPTWSRPQVVRFKSYDGLEIPGLLYKPRDGLAGSQGARPWSGSTAAPAASRGSATAA